MSLFSETLSRARTPSGLSQAELARAIGISAATLASWETGRRKPGWPSRSKIIEAADILSIGAIDLYAMLLDIDLEPVPPSRLAPLLDRRKPLDVIRDECQSYCWPTLAMNEDFEVVAWNEAANDLSELDFGVDLAEPGARHLLRMALSEHYEHKLQNRFDVIAIMMAMWKTGGFDPLAPDTRTPYFENLMAYVFEHHGTDLGRLLGLWQNAVPHLEGGRTHFVADWLSADGTALLFNCQLVGWSDYDAVSALDWHPANAATWSWLDARREERQARQASEVERQAVPTMTTARELLRFERQRNGLTQSQLAERAGLSADLVHSLEAGRKTMTERTLASLCNALALPAVNMNALLNAAGFAPRPSELSAYILGYAVPRDDIRYGASSDQRMNWTPAAISREVASYSWPVIVVNERCEVISTNEPANRLLASSLEGLGAGPARNLFALVTDAPFREATVNWETVVANVLPGNLEAYAAPPGIDPGAAKDETYFAGVVEFVRLRERGSGRGDDVIRRTFDAWRARPGRRLSSRIAFPFERTNGRATLRFDAVITPWDAMLDPYWAIELHPGDGRTWEWLG